MLANRYLFSIVFTVMLGLIVQPVLAEKEEAELPQSGSLASSVAGGYGNSKVAEPWGGSVIEGNAPLAGSVSKLSDREWRMRLFNNSEDTYDASVEVVQYDQRGSRLKSDNFSFRIKGGNSVERTVSSRSSTYNAEVKLKSWKNLTPKKDEEEESGDAAAASGNSKQVNRK